MNAAEIFSTGSGALLESQCSPEFVDNLRKRDILKMNSKKMFGLNSVRGRSLGLSLVSATALFAYVSQSHAVGTRHFVLETGSDFEKGEFEGVAVDSTGMLRPGFDLGEIEVSDADSLWAIHREGDALLLGTGNSGKLLRVRAGKVETVAELENTLAITSIVQAFGKTIVGALPGGKLFELKNDKLVEFAKLPDSEHVWALSFDEKAGALYVATGPEGKLFRVTADGTAQVYYDAPQGHLVSVLAAGGKVYAGSSGEARLFEISGPGRARVLYDFSSTEVRAIARGDDGSIFAVSNELIGGPRSETISKINPKAPSQGTATKGKGTLHRFFPNGKPEELYSSSTEHFVSLDLDDQGRPIVGTGLEGKVIRVDLDHNHAVLADVEARQVAGVIGAQKGGWVIANDPVVAHPIEGVGGKDAAWTSEVLDAGLRARFGLLTFDASGKVELSTRTGNSKKPDETWTDWSAPLSKAGKVTSEQGRYLQVRVRLVDAQARVSRIDVPFVTDNLRPVLTRVEAKSLAQTKGSSGIESSGGPLDAKPSSKIKLSWNVTNPDEDELRYRVEYRLWGDEEWFDALAPDEVLTSNNWDWETADLPEGRYRVRVTATDELSNAPERVLSHRLESETILVDNTAPKFSGLQVQGRKLVGTASDQIGPIRRIEMRVAGQEDWTPIDPKDGIFDEARETFDVDLGKLMGQSGGLLTVRVFDTAGNAEVEHVRVPKGG